MKLKAARFLRLIFLGLISASIVIALSFFWPLGLSVFFGSLIGAFSGFIAPLAYKPSLLLKASKKVVAFFKYKEKLSPEKEKKDILSKCHDKFQNERKLIARGGFSNVYSLKIEKSKKENLPVAIKCVFWKLNLTNKRSEHYPFLKQETDLLNKLKHENIISIYGHFEGINYFCLVMPLMETCLHDLIEKRKEAFDNKDIAYTIYSILCALKYLHETNWVHRDVKPDNVLVKKSKNGYQFFLADFGLAEPSNQVTRHFSGTLLWVSPELYKHFFDEGKKSWMLTSADDIYSATLILCCLCFGLKTFPSENPEWCRRQKKFTYEYSPFSLMMSRGQEAMGTRASASEMIAMIPSFRN